MKVTWFEFWAFIVGSFVFAVISHLWDNDISIWILFFALIIPFIILIALSSISENNQKEKNEKTKMINDIKMQKLLGVKTKVKNKK